LLAQWCLIVVLAPTVSGAPLLVTVGDVTHERAVAWVRGLHEGPLTIRAWPEGGGASIERSAALSPTHDFTAKVHLRPLQPATRYAYRIRHGDLEVRGAFRTAPSPADARPVSFLWSGDLGAASHCRHIKDGYAIFQAMRAFGADFFLFVGDTIYADHRCTSPEQVPGADFEATTLEQFWHKHRYNREDPHVQAFFRATAVYAIWDDHEVRHDFAGPTEPLTTVGLRAFLDYWPIAPPDEEPTRLYRRARWGKLLELFILDTRQYRSDNRLPDGPDKTMLGTAQRRWVLEAIPRSDAVWKVVVSSVPLAIPTGRTARDGWASLAPSVAPEPNRTGFAAERDAILGTLRARGVRNLVWITADVHYAQVIQHRPWDDFALYELIAGPLSAGTGQPRPLDPALRPRSLFSLGGINNFGAVAIDPSGLTVKIVDATGTVRYQHTIPPDPPAR